jgi:hypothetical protein
MRIVAKALESMKLTTYLHLNHLMVVEGRELSRGGMWSVYKFSEVEWGVGLGEMCEIEYCIL